MPKTNKVVIIKTCRCWDNKYFDIGWYSNFTGLPKCALQNFLTGLACGMFFLSVSVTMLWKNISTLCGIPTPWAPPNFLNWFLNMNTKNIFLDYSTRFGRSLCLLASSHLSPSHFLSGFSPVNALARFRIVLYSPRLTFSFNDMHPLSFSHLVCLFFFSKLLDGVAMTWRKPQRYCKFVLMISMISFINSVMIITFSMVHLFNSDMTYGNVMNRNDDYMVLSRQKVIYSVTFSRLWYLGKELSTTLTTDIHRALGFQNLKRCLLLTRSCRRHLVSQLDIQLQSPLF